MVGKSGLAVLAVMLGTSPASAACGEATIQTVSDDGDLIILSDGETFEVDPRDQRTASLWLEGESVLVCNGTIINTDNKDEKVSAKPH